MLQATRTDPVAGWKLDANEIKFYKDEGYLYLPGLISQADAQAMREEIIDIMLALGMTKDQLRKATGTADKLRQTTQYLSDGALDGLANSANLREIAGQLMEGTSSLYMPFTAVKCGGGGGRFHFHQDNQYTRFEGPGINIWFAMNDMSPANGCLQVVARSHVRGTLDSDTSGDGDGHRKTKIEPTDFLPVRMRAGDAIAFSRLTVHGSGPNVTDEPRVAYAVQFHRDDVKAVWDNREPRLLKGSHRWQTGGVDRIAPPEKKENLDGH